MNATLRLSPLLLVIVIVGCVADPYGRRPCDVPDDTPGLVTKVWHGKPKCWGTAAVVGRHWVATVAHLSEGDPTGWMCGGKPAFEVARIPTGGFDQIVVLRVEHTYEKKDVFLWNPGGEAHTAWTWQQGCIDLLHEKVLNGDSGAPVLDREGRLTGHVSGCQHCGKEHQVNVYSSYPRDFDPNTLPR